MPRVWYKCGTLQEHNASKGGHNVFVYFFQKYNVFPLTPIKGTFEYEIEISEILVRET